MLVHKSHVSLLLSFAVSSLIADAAISVGEDIKIKRFGHPFTLFDLPDSYSDGSDAQPLAESTPAQDQDRVIDDPEVAFVGNGAEDYAGEVHDLGNDAENADRKKRVYLSRPINPVSSMVYNLNHRMRQFLRKMELQQELGPDHFLRPIVRKRSVEGEGEAEKRFDRSVDRMLDRYLSKQRAKDQRDERGEASADGDAAARLGMNLYRFNRIFDLKRSLPSGDAPVFKRFSLARELEYLREALASLGIKEEDLIRDTGEKNKRYWQLIKQLKRYGNLHPAEMVSGDNAAGWYSGRSVKKQAAGGQSEPTRVKCMGRFLNVYSKIPAFCNEDLLFLTRTQ